MSANLPPSHDSLDTSVQFCPKVGVYRAMRLKRLNIETVRDLFWHIPRGYENHHALTPIADLKAGAVYTIQGTVISVNERKPRSRSRVRSILEAVIEDAGGTIGAVWFNQGYLIKRLKEGKPIGLHGKVEFKNHFLQITSPKIVSLNSATSIRAGIVPLYPLTERISQRVMSDIIQSAFERYGKEVNEFLPNAVLDRYRLCHRLEALRVIHFPAPNDGAPLSTPDEQAVLFDFHAEPKPAPRPVSSGSLSKWEAARYRLAFEEFFLHQYRYQKARGKIEQLDGIAQELPNPDPLSTSEIGMLDPMNPKHYPALFIQSLPFALTEEQKAVCREIVTDMHHPHPMNRLLQGDVGAGKTVVCLYAMLAAVAAGYQAVMMAPTDLLARQHLQTVLSFTKPLKGLRLAFLSGKSGGRESQETLLAMKTGSVDLVIGTHALFQERVAFFNLGLAVVDEQHKFGVNQRQQLLEKGNHPDLLIATATPIPRTLSLTLFGDMDVSTIRSLPPGRPPVITRWTHWGNEHKIWEFADEKIEQGQQMYVVCPIISASEELPHLPSTEEAFLRLYEDFFTHRRVAMLHGKLSTDEKNTIMNKLQNQEIDIVVSTTVVEVGVDLPNATIMVVLGADRFGLAQLHQLRGRVGRGKEKSYCILVTAEEISEYAQKRMKALERTRDGFVLAEEDLELRGPGEILGTRQSGEMMFRIADPAQDAHILQEANQAAVQVYRSDPELQRPEHRALKKELQGMEDPVGPHRLS